jgi:hypothetical protein
MKKKARRKKMIKLSTYGLAVAACVGTTALLANGNGKPTLTKAANMQARFTTDGAFRDGLYLGKLAVANGQSPRPAVGRWSTEQDRAMFSAGYRRGYDEGLASASLMRSR